MKDRKDGNRNIKASTVFGSLSNDLKASNTIDISWLSSSNAIGFLDQRVLVLNSSRGVRHLKVNSFETDGNRGGVLVEGRCCKVSAFVVCDGIGVPN